jgi:sec-independent protein translocase protein TatB
MFDFAWSELALIGVVALVAIGPKDMPVAIKSVAVLVKKARRMAGEFQTHIDDLMKEADLGEMRGHLNELRSLDLRGSVARAIDPDGSLRTTLMDAKPVMTGAPLAGDLAETFVPERPAMYAPPPYPNRFVVPPPDHLRPELGAPPAFIPPGVVAAEHAWRAAPAFIPPADVARDSSQTA